MPLVRELGLEYLVALKETSGPLAEPALLASFPRKRESSVSYERNLDSCNGSIPAGVTCFRGNDNGSFIRGPRDLGETRS